MRKKTPMTVAAVVGAAAALTLATPLAAQAHVTVDPSSTSASSYSVLTFSVVAGSVNTPTPGVTLPIPDSVASVTPTVNPGWEITESGNQVSYTAETPLPDDRRATFELSVKLPDAEAGEQLAFPVLQQCEVGSIDWAEVAAPGEAEPQSPAPLVVLTEATGDGHGHGTGTEDTAAGADAAQPATASDDVLARVLGIAGLVVGTVGLILGLGGRRNEVRK
jgi:uncharacterized protein YcnI